MRAPVEIRASVQVQGRSLQLQLQKDGELWNRQPQIQNCKITQQKREENCRTESRAISTILWYSEFTITIRNFIVLIPLHAIVQMIQGSCTHTCNMKFTFGLWSSCINCNMLIVHLVFNHHVTIPASCKVSTIQLSCINHYRLRA